MTNLVQTVTTIVGFVSDDAVLRLDNDSSEGNATALDLQVEAGKAPMTVNSDTRVDNLNADKIDGKDSTELGGEQGPQGPPGPTGPQGPPGSGLSPDQIYQVSAEAEGSGGETLQNVRVDCDEGDKVLGGGGDPFDPEEDELRISGVLGQNQGWNVTMKDNGDADVVQADAICADFPPLRAENSQQQSSQNR